MRISDPNKIRDVIERLKRDDADFRARNRAAINNLYNGVAPYTDREAEENNIFTNVQPLIAPRVAHEARMQLAHASMRSNKFFTINIDADDPDKSRDVSAVVTRHINQVLKRSMQFCELLRGLDANVVLHGKGPCLWDDPWMWCPKLISVDELKVPTNTLVDFSNLNYFAVYQEMSAAELWRKIATSPVDVGWNVPAVKALVKRLVDTGFESSTQSAIDFPEKMAEEFKQNGLYYGTDLIPTAKLWWFYQFVDEENEHPQWELCIIEDAHGRGENESADFIYKQKVNFADSIDKILHVQYADGSNVAPFRYHSVRGMGYLLYPVLNLTNRLFCRFMDSLFEACNQMFRNVGEQDGEKLAKVMLANMSVLPQGVEYVPAAERYTVNHNLVNAGMSMLRQLINENSASYVQDVDSGTRREMTATQVMAQVQQAGVLLNSLVNMQHFYRRKLYSEICRRFTIKNSLDRDVKKFQDEMRKRGYADFTEDFDRWDISVEHAIGGGNKVLELSQVSELIKMLPLYPPASRVAILRDFTLAMTDDPDKTARLLPDEPEMPTKTDTFATLAFGTLCQGAPVVIPDGIDHEKYAGILISLLSKRVLELASTGMPVSPETIVGLGGALQHVQFVVAEIGLAPQRKETAMQMMAQLEQIAGTLAELGKKQLPSDIDPETQAKIAAQRAMAQTKLEMLERAAAQKLAHRDAAHAQRLAADKLKLQAELEAKDYLTAAEVNRRRQEEQEKAQGQIEQR